MTLQRAGQASAKISSGASCLSAVLGNGASELRFERTLLS
jgi:hypothetical protein